MHIMTVTEKNSLSVQKILALFKGLQRLKQDNMCRLASQTPKIRSSSNWLSFSISDRKIFNLLRQLTCFSCVLKVWF